VGRAASRPVWNPSKEWAGLAGRARQKDQAPHEGVVERGAVEPFRGVILALFRASNLVDQKVTDPPWRPIG
jgi:hypothetical protein